MASLDDLAAELGCEPRALRAVAAVESNGKGFDSEGRPTIRFEGHIFNQRTEYRFRDSHPELATLNWRDDVPAGRGYEALEKAAALDREAAYESCSWGAFQIMGFNHLICGYPTATEMVDKMRTESGQLLVFAIFIKTNPGMRKALQVKDWQTFARLYNGPGQVDEYARRMAAAYAAEPAQPIDVTAIQSRLNEHRKPILVTGVMDDATRAAVRGFQAEHGLAVDGIVGRITRAALGL